MLMLHRRFCQLHSLYFILCFILAAGFLIQLKVFYHNHQKNLRLADYRSRINDLSDEMKTVMGVANITSELIRRLQVSVRTKRLIPQVKIS